ncbi:uncharacterized protein [Rutidosis leptorrhynchoides]|uniref:uncharacterized protein n=1 Tax=Rutidosis leptorrhynchoides TaxID=125765 RepID=UPI003A99E48F
MPAYEAKNHEELRWEDYKSTGKGGFGLRSGLSPFTSSPITNFSKGTTSISTTPVNPNPFGNTFTKTTLWGTPSISSTPVKTNPFSDAPTWKYPGPTPTATWQNPSPTSTSFTSQPLNLSPSANTSSKLFNPFGPRTDQTHKNPFTSQATNTSSWSFSGPTSATSTLCQPTTPPCLDAFWSTPINISSNSTVTTAVNSASVSHSSLYNTTVINSSVSPMHQLTTTTSHIPKSAALTLGQPSTASACWSTTINQPSISVSTQQPANSVWVAPKSSGLDSSFNQPTTSFTPCVPLTRNFNGEITGNISDFQLMKQPTSAASPFGTLPPKPQIFFDGSESTQLIQYGISSMPVKDKPTLVRNPMLTTRHLSRRSKLPVRKYDPKLNGPKTPFFSETTEIQPDVFVPRENPRKLVVFREMLSPRTTTTKNIQQEKFSDSNFNEDEKDDPIKDQELSADTVVDVPTKLQQLDYYTQPQVSELEANERAEPGFCSHVKDFVIGRHGYGSIKFLGETDVRNLDLEKLIQFNYREVIVYMDERMKPPVGEGLNKPAEITLLNIICVDKKTGVKYEDGLKVDRYTEMLKKKAVAQGVEFMSYDAVGGEWKFRVKHF